MQWLAYPMAKARSFCATENSQPVHRLRVCSAIISALSAALYKMTVQGLSVRSLLRLPSPHGGPPHVLFGSACELVEFRKQLLQHFSTHVANALLYTPAINGSQLEYQCHRGLR